MDAVLGTGAPMTRLLAVGNESLLVRLAAAHALLAFDFDGTLAPIVGDREAANMRPPTASLFAELCELYPCAVISGRARADVRIRLAGADVRFVIGNHGLEPGTDLSSFEEKVARAKPTLMAELAAYDGLELEDKGYSLAVHYRHSPQKRAARQAIARAVSALAVPMRVVPGKLVANIVPASAMNKGDALLSLRQSLGATMALYVGDDVTDEDVFRLNEPGRILTVRVGHSSKTAAGYVLRDQREIDVLLRRLVELRALRRGGRALPGR